MVVWGATPVATRVATDELEPLVVAVLRTLVAGALVLPVLATRGPVLPVARTGEPWSPSRR